MDRHAAIALIQQWMDDSSGYDEAVWPMIERHLSTISQRKGSDDPMTDEDSTVIAIASEALALLKFLSTQCENATIRLVAIQKYEALQAKFDAVMIHQREVSRLSDCRKT